MADNFKPLQAQTFSLAGAGAILGATSITFKSLTAIDGTLITMTMLGLKAFMTIEPGSGNQEEQISFTGITQNANGTATITGVSNVLFAYPYTETSGTVKTHAGSTSAVLSNTSGYYNQFPAKADDSTVSGDWTFTGNVTFSNFPVTPSNSDASTTVKGVTKLSTAPVLANNPIAVGTNDTRIPVAYAVDASGNDTYVIAPSPAVAAYVAGQSFTFKAATANTGAATLNVSGLGAKTIKKNVTTDLATGDILANQIVTVVYDGTNMQFVSNPSAPVPTVQTFTSSGTYTAPVGLSYAIIEMVGGGASGGTAGGGNPSHGAGGGGAQYLKKMLSSNTIGTSQTVTVGAGGAAPTSGSNNPGNNGTASSFGSLLTANPGTTTAGGTGTDGDINVPGEAGTAGGSINAAQNGKGGDSFWGRGGIPVNGNTTDGLPGTGYGSGSSGSSSGGTPGNGVAAQNGLVVVTEYYS